VRDPVGSLIVSAIEERGLPGWRPALWRHTQAGGIWCAATGLEVRGIAADRPLAFLVGQGPKRRGRSLLIYSEADSPVPAREAAAPPATAPICPARRAQTLGRLLARLHERGVLGADLGARGTRLGWRDGRLRPTLIALQAIRFPRDMHARDRAAELARLDEILKEVGAPEALRAETRRDYLRRLPLPASTGVGTP